MSLVACFAWLSDYGAESGCRLEMDTLELFLAEITPSTVASILVVSDCMKLAANSGKNPQTVSLFIEWTLAVTASLKLLVKYSRDVICCPVSNE